MKNHNAEKEKSDELKSVCCSSSWTLIVEWDGKWVEVLKCGKCGEICTIL